MRPFELSLMQSRIFCEFSWFSRLLKPAKVSNHEKFLIYRFQVWRVVSLSLEYFWVQICKAKTLNCENLTMKLCFVFFSFSRLQIHRWESCEFWDSPSLRSRSEVKKIKKNIKLGDLSEANSHLHVVRKIWRAGKSANANLHFRCEMGVSWDHIVKIKN